MPLYIPKDLDLRQRNDGTLAVDNSEELDIHAIFGSTRLMRTGLDVHMEGAAWDPLQTIKPSDYWDGETVTCPATILGLALRTKAVYNCASFYTFLPQMPNPGQYCWFGFENDGTVGTGISSFRIANIVNVGITLQAVGGGSFTFNRAVITDALPADYATTMHRYDIQVLKPWTEFYIDYNLVALIINSPNLNFTDVNYPPYAIERSFIGYTTENPGLVELVGLGANLTWDINQRRTRFTKIDPLPPRVFRVYDAGVDTLWAGMDVENGVDVTSHPFPLLGYEGKTIDFEATCAGTLFIEVLMQTNNWAEYPPDAGTAIVADVLENFPVTGDEVLGRLRFTPGADGEITDAEVHLR